MTSLRSRLTTALMMPLLGLAIAFGFIICWMIWQSSNQTSDRVLIGSVRLISQAVDADDEVRDKMIANAILLLKRRSTPVNAFSVWDGDHLILGDPRLRPPPQYDLKNRSVQKLYPAAHFPKIFRNIEPSSPHIAPNERHRIIQPIYFRPGFLGDQKVRIATEIVQLHHNGHPVVIQAADFEKTRQYHQYNYFLRVFVAATWIVMIAAILFYWAIAWGLSPFASLTTQIEAAQPEQQSQFRLSLKPNAPHEAHLLAGSFNALLARTDRAIDSLRQFTANASHQMRTPLAIVRVHLDILQRDGAKSSEGKAAIDDISKAVMSLEHLLLQLLTLARAEEVGIDESSQFDLADITTDVITARITQPEAVKLDISFENHHNGPLIVLGHPDLATEMLANLFDNAIRYNREGGSVIVRLKQLTDQICLEIEDDGPGIPSKDQKQVFERFYRAQNSRNILGSGLGLPIVRTLAERMGAEVSLNSGANGRGVLARILFRSPHVV